MARKVFASEGLTKLVQYLFLGAPNPYLWNESAVRTAVLRRRVLDVLVSFWFGSKLRVARAYRHAWNRDARAFEMACELIDGRHVALRQPFTAPWEQPLRDATRRVLKPLQARLAEAGFDGLVWQAGRGNPVALNNFLCVGPHAGGGYRWVWIDLESGVPALIPINPLHLLLFYLPKSIRHRRPLFDDVDVPKLKAYVALNRHELSETVGRERIRELLRDVDALEVQQRDWKSLSRLRRSIGYRLARGAITPSQAHWYARRPLSWYRRESANGFRAGLRLIRASLAAVTAAVAKIKLGRAIKTCCRAIGSAQFRAEVARDYVGARIDCWQRRRQLSDREADGLRSHLGEEEASAYLTDFGVVLAIKPFVKTLQWWVLPALWTLGVIDETVLALFLVAGGAIVRTLYTLGRVIQNTIAGRERPWVALTVGAVPIGGNLAYPLQIIRSSTHAEALVAQFILYDTFSQLGQWLPIWGGADTQTEHLLNRVPDTLMRICRARRRPASAGMRAYSN